MAAKSTPMPIPINSPYLRDLEVTLLRTSEQLFASNCSPLSCLTVLMEAKDCQARPPASEYSFSCSFSLFQMVVPQMMPPIAMKGRQAMITRAITHLQTSAMMQPAMNMPMVIRMLETFSPMAPWKAKQSVANLVDSSDWLMVSNHPIYCLSRLLRYCFRHSTPCLSPVIIQVANMPHPAKKAAAPMYRNWNMTFFEAETMSSELSKESVMLPQSTAKDGMATPDTKAQMVPTVMSTQSVVVAYLNISQMPTEGSSSSYSSSGTSGS